MGASFHYNIYKEINDKSEIIRRADILRRWNDDVTDSIDVDGDDYSGAIGMLGIGVRWNVTVFKSEREASEFLMKAHKKWSQGIGVSFIENGSTFWMIGGWCAE